MAWTTKTKGISLHKATPHPSRNSALVGRAPGFSTISFGPLDLFGAAARCGHLNAVNPALVTAESNMVAALIEQYVDDVSNDFAILNSAANFKDYIKSYFAGTVASGLAYLAMIRDGYIWSSHFETAGGGNSWVRKSPDFVFSGPGLGVALVESKGTRSADLSAFDGTVNTGYVKQVEPHLGYTIGGSTATHGYCIGGWLTSATKAELLVHHTAIPASGGGGTTAPPAAIQRQNYATAFTLAHSAKLGAQLRGGEPDEPSDVIFARVIWKNRSWLTGFASLGWPDWWREDYLSDLPVRMLLQLDRDYYLRSQKIFFAVEEGIAKAVFGRFLALEPQERDVPLLSLDRNVDAPLATEDGRQSGAFFPDGLAVIRSDFELSKLVKWNPQEKQFNEIG